MAIRNLKVNFLQSGAEQAKLSIDSVGAAADKFGKKDVKAKVGIDDKAVSPRLAELQKKLDVITKRKNDLQVTANTAKAQYDLARMGQQVDKLSRMTANPNISIRGVESAEVKLLGLEATMDRVAEKSRIDGMEAGTSFGSGFKGGFSELLMNPAVFALGATLLPALLPSVIGVGTALGGVLGAAMVNKGFRATLTKQIPIFEGILNKATQPIAAAFTKMLPQIDAFARGIGPELAAAFSASAPFLRMFVTVLEQAGQILLPAFTQSMRQMTPYLPQLAKGFATLMTGVAQFITLMGPEMKNSVVMFDGAMKGAQIALNVLGVAVDYFTGVFHLAGQMVETMGKVLIDVVQGKFGAAGALIKQFGHDVGDTFDTLRHVVATALGNMGLDQFGHSVASTFDGVRHDVSAWSDDFVHIMGGARSYVTGWSSDMSSLFVHTWGNIENVTTGGVKSVENWIMTGWSSVYSNTSRTWSLISNAFSGSFASIKGIAGSSVDWIRSKLSEAWSDIAGDARRMWAGIASGIGSAFNGIKSVVETPINWVLTNVIDKADGMLNKIPGISLPTNLHLASGGLITMGTGPTADDVPAFVSRGETVVSAAHSRLLAPVFRAAGVPGYAAGGIPGGGILGDIGHAAADVGKGLLSAAENNPLSKAIAAGASDAVGASLNALLGTIPGGGLGLTIAKAFGNLIVSALKNVFAGAQQDGPLGTAAAGNTMANGRAIFAYLRSSLGMSPIAAAGALAGMYGESAWNPEAHEPASAGDGPYNGGLMGFTPLYNYLGHISGSRSNVPDSVVTGNATNDLDHQLKAIGEYLHAFGMGGVVAEMNRAGSILEAANLWGVGVERYGINDVHSAGLSYAAQIMGSSASQIAAQTAAANVKAGSFNGYSYDNGGLIPETVRGVGLRSGKDYMFHANEWVTPGGRHISGGGGGDTYVNVEFNGVVGDPDAVATQIHQMLRAKKTRHGGQKLGLD